MNGLSDLFTVLQKRQRPEDVIPGIIAVLGDSLTDQEAQLLKQLVRQPYYSYSLMPTKFVEPEPLAPAKTLCAILGLPAPTKDEARDPVWIRALLDRARGVIGVEAGRTDFKADRLNSEGRRERGMEISRRRYNKLFRLIADLESEAADLEIQVSIARLLRIAKISYAMEITWEDFSADPNSAAFVTYMTTNLARRSIFTNGPQARAFDAVSEMLQARCAASPTSNWFAIAHVFPRADVLANLSQMEKLRLLDRVLDTMRESARLLRWSFERSDLNLQEMIVHSGDDSSTWNALAGAWNRARDYWIALLTALGYQWTFETFLPGKVLRLMAADVARWHRWSSGGLHPDTKIWADLPKPWEVMLGETSCGLPLIAEVCTRHGVDPEQSAWTAARARTTVASVTPTPELVHGVTINHPELAAWLRRIGAFSGYGLKVNPYLPLGNGAEA